ncbi:MAG: ABC transporter substrate-binding protein [Candidatus Jorgensenbacteria bacterium]|nr:ABC transporter substrate-binding protein [Candidatus Jorgensenbacteria bacterium]
MQTLKLLLKSISQKERVTLTIAFAIFVFALTVTIAKTIEEKGASAPVRGGSYTEGVVGQPIMINPIFSSNQTDRDISALVYSDMTSLISDWKISDDGREYSVKLKEGLVWSDKEPLTSDDIIFTIQTIQNPDARSALIKDWQGVEMERVSQLQVKFILPSPYVFFTKNLKNTRLIPKHIFGSIPIENISLSEYNLEPIGSGPYKFSAFSKRKDGFITEYKLITNENFEGQKPYIEQFAFDFYSSSEDLLKDLRLRRIDGFGSSLPLGAETQSLPRVKIENVDMPRYYAIFMNAINNPELKDKNLRVALGMAINKEKIKSEIFKGNVSSMDSPLFKNLVSFEPQTTLAEKVIPQWTPTDSIPSYDPEVASRLIAGLKNKEIKLNLVIPKVPFLKKVAEQIKEDWLSSGISEVTITEDDTATLMNDYVKTRNYELLLFGNVYENPADLFPFWHSSQRFYPGLNLSIYQNTEADGLMEVVRQKNDPETQKKNLERVETILKNDAPATFLFSMPYFYVHSSLLNGFNPGSITSPEDRFTNVAEWNLSSVRILK